MIQPEESEVRCEMGEFYFDIETTGLDPAIDELVLVAYQPIKWNKPSEELRVVSRWSTKSEKELVKKVLELGILDFTDNRFSFVPVGTNLHFDLSFVIERASFLGLAHWSRDDFSHFYRNKPMKDVSSALVMMNDGMFKGSGLDTFTKLKPSSGNVVPELWARKDFQGIEKYARADAAGFFEVYGKLSAELRDLGEALRAAHV